MSEYISKEKVKDFVRSGIRTDTEADKEYVCSFIDSIPSADVRPNMHGHWELVYPTREEVIYCQERYVCSNCKGYVVDRIARLELNFCPKCGADMREPKGEKGET